MRRKMLAISLGVGAALLLHGIVFTIATHWTQPVLLLQLITGLEPVIAGFIVGWIVRRKPWLYAGIAVVAVPIIISFSSAVLSASTAQFAPWARLAPATIGVRWHLMRAAFAANIGAANYLADLAAVGAAIVGCWFGKRTRAVVNRYKYG